MVGRGALGGRRSYLPWGHLRIYISRPFGHGAIPGCTVATAAALVASWGSSYYRRAALLASRRGASTWGRCARMTILYNVMQFLPDYRRAYSAPLLRKYSSSASRTISENPRFCRSASWSTASRNQDGTRTAICTMGLASLRGLGKGYTSIIYSFQGSSSVVLALGGRSVG